MKETLNQTNSILQTPGPRDEEQYLLARSGAGGVGSVVEVSSYSIANLLFKSLVKLEGMKP